MDVRGCINENAAGFLDALTGAGAAADPSDELAAVAGDRAAAR